MQMQISAAASSMLTSSICVKLLFGVVDEDEIEYSCVCDVLNPC